jgi:hypothetical protein
MSVTQHKLFWKRTAETVGNNLESLFTVSTGDTENIHTFKGDQQGISSVIYSVKGWLEYRMSFCNQCKLRGQFKYKTEFLSQAQRFPHKKITWLVVRDEIPAIVITFRCVSTCFLSPVITLSEQVVPSAGAQRIIKFLTNENVKRFWWDSENSWMMKRSQGPGVWLE